MDLGVVLGTVGGMFPNFVVWLLDDMGQDQVRQYNVDPDSGEAGMPVLDSLIQDGVMFTRAHTQPLCSPTRAAMLTSRWGFQTGVLELAEATSQPLLEAEVCLPTALKAACPTAGYKCGVFGKWHLSSFSSAVDPTQPPSVGEREHPIRCGFDDWFGQLRNLGAIYDGSYYTWTAQQATRGPLGIRSSTRTINGYAPRVQMHAARDWIAQQVCAGKPFLCFVPANLPHDPLHRPPADLYDTDTYSLANETIPDGSSAATKRTYMKAMSQAQDTLLGQLLESLDPATRANTWVIFMTDNGTQSEHMPNSLNPLHGKRTLYNLGIQNPLVVTGPKIDLPGRTEGGIVCITDLFPTIIELAGGDSGLVPLPPGGTRSGISFGISILDHTERTARIYGWSDLSAAGPNLNCTTVGSRALYVSYDGVESWKLLQKNSTGVNAPANNSACSSNWEFYDTYRDPLEKQNLIGAQATAGAFPANTLASPFVSGGNFNLVNGNVNFPSALTVYELLATQFLTWSSAY